jgi:hypothetical protein
MKKKAEGKIQSIETFQSVGSYELLKLTQNEPSCYNGAVRVRKFKVTIEPIDEPNEVIAERLQVLWDSSDNHHEYEPLRRYAKSIGYELKGNWGNNRKKK